MALLSSYRRNIKAVLDTCSRYSHCQLLSSPASTTAFRHLPRTELFGPDCSNSTPLQPNHRPPDPRLVSKVRHSIPLSLPASVVTMGYKGQPDPVIRTASPAPLAQDFARQQLSKQQRSNYHSSSLSSSIPSTMVSQSVNKTNLHPTGVQ